MGDPTVEQSLFDYFRLGGWAMWPLLVLSVTAVTLILERGFLLLFRDLSVHSLSDRVVTALKEGNWKRAGELCAEAPAKRLAAPVLGDVLAAAHLGERRMERAAEAAAAEQIHRLERGFDLLTAIGAIAPITGFLGTVSGMIAAFSSIAAAERVNAQLVAAGIYEALITTAYGLAIALVAVTAYNLFAHLVDRFSADLEEAANRLIVAILEEEGPE